MRTKFAVAMLAAMVVTACHAPSPTEIATALTGNWSQVETIPGNGFTMTLTAVDTTVSGSGTFVGEAGPQGTVTVSGTVSGDQVTLDFVFQTILPNGPQSWNAQFVGRLVGRSLVGTLQNSPPSPGNPPQPTTYVRP